jgi:phosphate transport system protein
MIGTTESYDAAFNEIKGHFHGVFNGGMELLGLASKAVETREVLSESQLREVEERQDLAKKALEQAVVRTLVNYMVPPGDVRRIIGIVRSTADLERIGDNAVQIVVAVREANHEDLSLPDLDLRPLLSQVTQLVTSSVDTLLKDDVAQIERNLRLEDEIDEAYKQITRDLVTGMMRDPATIPGSLVYLNIVRRLERIADHAGNIIEHYNSIVKEEES